MEIYSFTRAYGYEIEKGYISAINKEEAIRLIKDGRHDDIVDVYESDVLLAEGYELIEIW